MFEEADPGNRARETLRALGVIVAERRLLLIHYAQTQFDDLFAPEQTSAPLATPGE